jgi:putative transposase
VNGVSTHKVERRVAQIGVESVSRSTVSRLCETLGEQVTIFRERPSAGRYPYLWLDAKAETVRELGEVSSKALFVCYGVHESVRREVIGLDIGETEGAAFWRKLLRSLVARGLVTVRLCISNAHEGLRAAIAQVLSCP